MAKNVGGIFMSRGRYHAAEFKAVNWVEIEEQTAGQRIVFAIDIAKDNLVGTLMRVDRTPIKTLKWTHPRQTGELVKQLEKSFDSARFEVVMEPSGTYGDALRGLFVNAGVRVFRISPKRVHDAAELYDGVPSLHDAKAAYLIARLHLDGVSQRWQEPSKRRRALSAQLGLLEMYRARYQRSLNRLEALLSRHWPEGIRLLEVGSATLLKLVATYGDAKTVAIHAEEAEELMRRTGRVGLRQEKIEQMLESARDTVGMPCIEAERLALQLLAQDMIETREKLRQVEIGLERQVEADPVLKQMVSVVELLTYLCARRISIPTITTRRDLTATEIVEQANKRCNQENVISQLKNGVNAMRMPVQDLESNWAYMIMTALAWNLKAWFGLLMPNRIRRIQVLKMEFRRFLQMFILIPCVSIVSNFVANGCQTVYHVSASPPCHPGRSDYPSPVGDHSYPMQSS